MRSLKDDCSKLAAAGEGMDSALGHSEGVAQLILDTESLHSCCFACGDSEIGLGLKFVENEDGSVAAEWLCRNCYQSYDGIIHGGIVATLLDAAMTNCLLAQGIEAVTADLEVRYKAPLRPGKIVYISARLVGKRGPTYSLESQVKQDGGIAAAAKARFMKRKCGECRSV